MNKFRVRDRVRYIGCSSRPTNLVGSVGMIFRFYPGNPDLYGVVFNGKKWVCQPRSLELALEMNRNGANEVKTSNEEIFEGANK